MSEDDNRRMIQRFYREAVGEGRIEVVDELVAEDVVEHEQLPGQDEPAQGRESMKEIVRNFTEAFPDLEPRVEAILADGDRMAARVTWTGTHEGSFYGIEPSNETVEMTRLDMFRFEDGKIREHWGVEDNLSMMSQMGKIGPSER